MTPLPQPPPPPPPASWEDSGYLPTSGDALRCPAWRREWNYQNGEGPYAEREPDPEDDDDDGE